MLLTCRMRSSRAFEFLLAMFCLNLLKVCKSFEIDNGITDEPNVTCDADSVIFNFRTQNAFTGKIFVKGHYSEAECKVDHTDSISDSPSGKIAIKHGKCDMERQRMISPQGMQFSTVIIVSFHPVFITKVDKAYSIKCMYREAEKFVTASLDVSMLPTIPVTQNFPMPSCTYTIRRDEIDGEILRYAKVGDQVVHRWECDSSSYGILVHSCYVEDGQGEKVLVIDDKGCHTDRLLLGDPTYIEALNMAYRESHIFKFADRVAVRFQCQIKLCLKINSGCNDVTPPLCDSVYSASRLSNKSASRGDPLSANRSRTDNTSLARRYRRNSDTSQIINVLKSNEKSVKNHEIGDYHDSTIADGDFQSQFLYVLDAAEMHEKGKNPAEDADWKEFLQGSLQHRQNFCFSSTIFLVFSSFLTFFILAPTCALVVYLFRRRNKKTAKICRNLQIDYATPSEDKFSLRNSGKNTDLSKF